MKFPYVVLGGFCHVPSPLRYLACAPAAGAGTAPAAPAAEAVAAFMPVRASAAETFLEPSKETLPVAPPVKEIVRAV